MIATGLELTKAVHLFTTLMKLMMERGFVPGMPAAAKHFLKDLIIDSTFPCFQEFFAKGFFTSKPCSSGL